MEATAETLSAIEAKIDKGEALSAEEKALIESAPDTKEQTEAAEETEKIDPEAVKIKKVEEKKEEKKAGAEDTPSEKDAEAAKAKEKEAAEEAAAKEAERKKLIEAEAAKPLDEADITNFSQRERAIFFELKEERIKRQNAQREADTLKFQKAKEETRRQIEAEKEAEAERLKAEEAADPFKGLEDGDLPTVGQIRELLAKQKKTRTTEPNVEEQRKENQRVSDLQSKVWILEAQSKMADAVEICNVGGEHLDLLHDAIAAAAVKEVVDKGGNPVIATVNYLKSHPKWPEIEAKLKAKAGGSVKSEEEKAKQEEARINQERADRIEKNKKKPVTTGSGGGSSAAGEYTVQEILDMSDEDYSKLPKSQRDKILEAL
jgi:hypothetical protein